MADVDDAGQIVLVTALVLAATLVGLALVLNTVIFAENLATRQTSDELDRSQEYHGALNQSTTDALSTVNENPVNSSHAKLRANLSETLEDKMVIYQRDATISGSSVAIGVDAATGGFLLKQTNASRSFTGGEVHDGDRNWTLVTDAAASTQLRQNISRESTFMVTVDTTMEVIRNRAYTVRISNDTYTWNVYVTHWDDGNILFVTERSDMSMSGKVVKWYNQSCVRNTEFSKADYHAGTVDGTSCRALSFYPNLTEDIDITYNNTVTGGEVQSRGTYQLRAANSSVHRDAFHAVSDDESPFKVTALLDSDVVLTHQTTNHRFLSRLQVRAPSLGRVTTAERDPNITKFTVVDDTDDSEEYDFEVTVEANDPDGNLDHATFNLTDDEGRQIENATVPMSGGVDSATHTFQDTDLLALFDDDGNFTISVVVYDATGMVDNDGEPHKADGDDTYDGDKYPSRGGAEVPASDAQAGGTGADLARATPTPTEEVTDAVATPEANTTAVPEGTVNETTNTTDVEGDL